MHEKFDPQLWKQSSKDWRDKTNKISIGGNVQIYKSTDITTALPT